MERFLRELTVAGGRYAVDAVVRTPAEDEVRKREI